MSNATQARFLKAGSCLLLLLSFAWASHVYAVQPLWTKEEVALLSQVAELEERPRPSAADLQVLQSGFESRLDRIRIAAIRVVLLQRQSLRDFWADAKDRPVRGTSAQLLPIVDAVFAPRVDVQRPLIEILPRARSKCCPRPARLSRGRSSTAMLLLTRRF